jgi:hypothetical protein
MTSCKACMAARLSSEDDTKTKTSTRPDVEEAIMKRPATPPGPARDAKTASDAAMDSLSATYRPRPPRLRLCGGTGFRKERAATAAEAARGAAYAAAAATTAQEALIQAQAAEAEALKARDLVASQLGDDAISRHVHRGLGDSKFPCEGRCAGAASSAVAAAAAAHETALAAAKAFLKAFYASSLLPRPPLPLSSSGEGG